MQPVERQQQQFHADQRKQQGVEHVIEQFPEAVQVAPGHVVHRQLAAEVADDQARHHHRNGCRDVQFSGHRRAADHQGQGQHHFDLILLDALDHQVHDVADQPAKHHAANRFMGKQHGRGADRRRLAQLRDAQQHGEHHHRGAVVEQRFADDGGFQRFRRIGGPQHTEYGNRVGGGNQRAEQQAVQETHVPAEQGKDVEGQAADHHRGNQYAEGGEQADGPAVAAQVAQVDVQGAGEQQEREHPVHQQVAEVDLADQLLDALFKAGVADKAQALQQQGKHQCRDHHTDGGRQADEAVVHIREQGGEANKRSDKFKHPGSLDGGVSRDHMWELSSPSEAAMASPG